MPKETYNKDSPKKGRKKPISVKTPAKPVPEKAQPTKTQIVKATSAKTQSIKGQITKSQSQKTPSRAQTVQKNPDEIYKAISDKEAAQVNIYELEEDTKKYVDYLSFIKRQLEQMKILKQSNKFKDNKEKLKQCFQNIYAITVKLKIINRRIQQRNRNLKETLYETKGHATTLKMRYQNSQSELNFLYRSIEKCHDYKSDIVTIDLIPVSEFYNKVPEKYSKSELTKNNEHLQTIARLEWELHQRKKQSAAVDKLRNEKLKIAADIRKKEELYASLVPDLKNIIEVTKPLEERLRINVPKISERKLAYKLPKPLYVLYAKFHAFNVTHDNQFFINIDGNLDDLNNFKEKCFLDREETLHNEIDIAKILKAQDEISWKTTNAGLAELSNHKFFTQHPLSVQILMKLDKPQNYSIRLDFIYRLNMKIITLKHQVTAANFKGIAARDLLDSGTLLRNLFPNDDGTVSPNPANYVQISQINTDDMLYIIENITGYPYMWVQRLCDIDFMDLKYKSASFSNDMYQSNIEYVAKLIFRRFRIRISLASQVQDLESMTIPSVPKYYGVPEQIISIISSWKRICWSDYKCHPTTESLIQNKFVKETNIFYEAVVIRAMAKLRALIAVNSNYPYTKPIFTITIIFRDEFTSQNSIHIRDIERAVNSEWTLNPSNINNLILSAQVRRLMTCFDVYLEILHPKEFTSKKVYISQFRGKTNRLPLKFLHSGGGIFTHY